MKTLNALLLIAVCFATSCVVPQMVETSSPGTHFTKFKKVSYVIRETPETEYGSDRNYDKSTLALLHAMLGSKLSSMGFEITDPKHQPELAIDITITAVKQGNAALRFLVGFGAGRAVLTYRAQFTDGAGNRLGTFDGGRSHTGNEFGESFADADLIQAIAVTKSVQQIEEFINNNGSLTVAERAGVKP